MITNALLSFIASCWSTLCGLFPAPSPPSWFSSVASFGTSASQHFAGVGSWLPFDVLSAVIATLLSVVVASFALKGLRIVASFLTAGGGSAG